MGMFSLAGFSLRGGTMAGVIQAIGGRETFWLLAVELAVFGLISAGAFAWAGRMARDDKAVNPSGGAYAGMIQVLAAAVVIWLLGKSYQKGQAVGCVFIAGMAASWVSYIVTGSTWRYGWSVPLIVGVFGYVACALWGSTSPVVMGNVDAFAIASPLDYAAFGPVGVILGEILHKEETTRQE